MIAPTLTTERLTLRMPEAADLPAYRAYCASERARFVGGPFSSENAFEKLCAMSGHWAMRGFGRYVILCNGEAIGHVGPLQISDDVAPEMTWTLWSDAAEGHGYATEAAKAVVRHLFDESGWQEMIIRIQPENTGSINIAERIGATRTDEPAPAWYPGAVTYRLYEKVPT